jgi:hypothetical protein
MINSFGLGLGLGVNRPGARPLTPGFVPTDLPSLALWLGAGEFYTDVDLTTPAVESDPVAGWKDLSGGERNATQDGAEARPPLTATGLGGGADLWLDVSGPTLDDLTIYFVGTRASGQNLCVFGTNPGTGTSPYCGIYSDNTAYLFGTAGTFPGNPVNQTGRFLGRFDRTGGTIAYAGTGIARAEMAFNDNTSLIPTAILARAGADYTHADARLEMVLAFSANLQGTANDVSVRAWIDSNYGVSL